MKLLRILLIEDDAVIAMALAEMLVEMGHTVSAIAATEADAVAAARRFPPDLVIADAWLREGSGIAAVKEICRVLPAPHFFVSGDPSSVKALRPDAVIVQKPFHEADLASAIKRAFDTSPLLVPR